VESVSIKDLRQRIGELVDAAIAGETVAITRRGRKVACISPVLRSEPELPDLTEFRASLLNAGQPLSEIVIEQREAERY
jgi:prevent-host-death family protein